MDINIEVLSEYEWIMFMVCDKIEIEGYLMLLKIGEVFYLMVIFFYGGLGVCEYSGFDYWIVYFIICGYVVLWFNFCGFFGYGYLFGEL